MSVAASNFHDRNAIAVEKDGRIAAGYLPRKGIKCPCSFSEDSLVEPFTAL